MDRLIPIIYVNMLLCDLGFWRDNAGDNAQRVWRYNNGFDILTVVNIHCPIFIIAHSIFAQ